MLPKAAGVIPAAPGCSTCRMRPADCMCCPEPKRLRKIVVDLSGLLHAEVRDDGSQHNEAADSQV